jgi:hypothetical protein
VVPRGLDADEEALGDLSVGEPTCHEPKHLDLSLLKSPMSLAPVRPLTPRSRRKEAARSASAVAPRRSKADSAARASEMARDRSWSTTARASSIRARQAINGNPVSLIDLAASRSNAGASEPCRVASIFPLANRASPSWRRLWVREAMRESVGRVLRCREVAMCELGLDQQNPQRQRNHFEPPQYFDP